MDMTGRKFEATCRCGERITGGTVQRPWRHDAAPAEKHPASPVTAMTEI
jgi:hypothetical protein